jgi:hypothetical protein
MPTNIASSWKPVVTLKPNQKCSWKIHFRPNTAGRSIIGGLQIKAHGPLSQGVGFLRPRVKPIAQGSKKYSKKDAKDSTDIPRYGSRQAEYVLAFLRDKGIISPRGGLSAADREYFISHGLLDANDPAAGPVGFYLTPHDQLCRRDGNTCTFVGYPPAIIPDGRHYPDELCFAPGAHGQKNPKGAVSGAPVGALQGALQNPKGAPVGALRNEKGCASGCASETPQPTEKERLTESAEMFGGSLAARTPLTQSVNSINSSNSINSEIGDQEKSQDQTQPDRPVDSFEMTDQSQNHKTSSQGLTDQRKTQTIGQHFQEVSIESISDGEIKQGEIRYHYWESLLQCCRMVVEQNAAAPFLGRRTCGDLMAKAMGLLKERYDKKTPPAWYSVAKKLRADLGPTINSETYDYGEPSDAIMRMAAQNAGIVLPSDFETAYDHELIMGYRAAWELIEAWDFKRGDRKKGATLPEFLYRLRDWLWQADATDNKPPLKKWTPSRIAGDSDYWFDSESERARTA